MADRIDFFRYCETSVCSKNRFGLCDPRTQTPAYIDFYNFDSWIAVVENDLEKEIGFLAVDHNVPFPVDKKRCDALLFDKEMLLFVELKKQRGSWLPEALVQLTDTVEFFKENHDVSVYKNRKAYACNKCHPNFNFSYKEYMQDFRKRHGFILRISTEIKI